jgi:predicted Rossmann-fold nucleotide-binding protein
MGPVAGQSLPTYEQTLERLDDMALRTALIYAHEMASGRERLQGVGGSVYFGSAVSSSAFEEMVFLSARDEASNGNAVTTGGAGGFMEVANSGAMSVGGVSVGIPMGGVDGPSDERSRFSEVHTLTLPVSDYSTRIPLLLHEKSRVYVAPGRSGTMREVAVTLLEMMKTESRDMELGFLGQSFYAPLTAIVRSLPLPDAIKGRIRLVDSGEGNL